MHDLLPYTPLTRTEYETALEKLQGGLEPQEMLVFHRGLSMQEYAASIADGTLEQLISEIRRTVKKMAEDGYITIVHKKVMTVTMHGERKLSEPAEIARGIFERIAIGTADGKSRLEKNLRIG